MSISNFELSILESIKVESGTDGVSVVTARVPSHVVSEVVGLVETILHVSRCLRTRTRVSEAIYKARQLKIIA